MRREPGDGQLRPDARGVIWTPAEDGGFDGVLALGPWTASPPMGTED